MEHPLSGFSEHRSDVTHLRAIPQVYAYSKWKQQAYLTDTRCDFWIKLLILNVLRTMGQCFSIFFGTAQRHLETRPKRDTELSVLLKWWKKIHKKGTLLVYQYKF